MVVLLALSHKNVIDHVVEHLNYVVWIVVDSTPVFVDPDHFLRGLGLLDSFLVPGENQEGWSQQQPDTSSALASVEVEDH